MISLTIPGRGELQLEHLILDVNGTLAVDGQLVDGVFRRLSALRDRLEVHLLTADTHGKQDQIDRMLGLSATRLQAGNEAQQKADFLRALGTASCAAIGQGANDALMLAEAALGVCVLSTEGAAVSALTAADLVAPDILSALDLFDQPARLLATLRQ